MATYVCGPGSTSIFMVMLNVGPHMHYAVTTIYSNVTTTTKKFGTVVPLRPSGVSNLNIPMSTPKGIIAVYSTLF